MKKIVILCNNDIELLKSFLQDRLKNANLQFQENDIIVYIDGKSQLEILSLSLAVFCINNLEAELISKITKTIPKERYNHKTFLQVQDHHRKFLYIEPLKILILEHLKLNDTIKLESFIIFNCRGIQKDFYNLGKDYIQLYSYESNNKNLASPIADINNIHLGSGGTFVDSAVTYYSYIKELNDMIFKFKKESNISKSDYKKFSEIHLKTHKGQLFFTDNENKVIESDLKRLLPESVIKSLKGNDDALRMTIILLTCISILKTSCVVFHKTIPKETLSRILLFLYDSREVNKELTYVNLLECNFCDMCKLPSEE